MLIGQKTKTEGGIGTQYHVKERLTQTKETKWYYKERDISFTLTSILLIYVIIGKIKNRDWLINMLHNNPIRQRDSS